MAIVALFSGSYCHAEELAEALSTKLGCAHVGEEHILDEASKEHGLPRERLATALYGPPPLLAILAEEKAYPVACVRAALAGRLAEDTLVYRGFATHLIAKDVTHVLRVCLVANQDYKTTVAMEKEGVAEKKARALVKADTQSQSDWVYHVAGLDPWDEDLYDMVVPMSTHSVAEAVDLIAANAAKEVVQATPQSRKAVDDFALAAQVYLALAKKWPDVDVLCEDGEVTLHINKYVVWLESLKKKLAAAASAVPGVKHVEAGLGPKCKRPAIHRDLEFDTPPKILLVDDEREFVDTLSERLLAREMASTVAYDGHEALSQVAKDEPEVMVLDLKMPGIDGMEVLRKVRAERPNVEVIILTGHGSEKDMALAEELGAFAYLQKPVDIDVLTQTMKEAYRKIHEGREAGDHAEGR